MKVFDINTLKDRTSVMQKIILLRDENKKI
jgi:hypothetical protein